MGIQTGVGGPTEQNKSIKSQEDEINVLKLIEDLDLQVNKLDDRAKNTNMEFDKLETRMERQQNFIGWVVFAMALGFVFTNILVALDYFKYTNERYINLADKIEKTKPLITQVVSDSLKDFKDCVWLYGLSSCLK